MKPLQKDTPTRRRKLMAKTTDAAIILRKRLGDDQELRQMISQEKVNVKVARMIYDARNSRGLTQKELADLVGTK